MYIAVAVRRCVRVGEFGNLPSDTLEQRQPLLHSQAATFLHDGNVGERPPDVEPDPERRRRLRCLVEAHAIEPGC